MTVITGNEATSIRNAFLDVFIDKRSDSYQSIIMQLQASGRMYYYGYLWDCLTRKNLEIVSYTGALNFLQRKNEFFLFWDNHPQSYFLARTPGWEYPKNSLFLLSGYELENILQRLPEDCYFFDDSLSWAIALTHEESKPGRRICYYITL